MIPKRIGLARTAVAAVLVLPLAASGADVATPFFRAPILKTGNVGIHVLSPIDEARWIAHPEQGMTPAFWRFEREFDADGDALEIDVSADERYVLLLDGTIIGRGPDRCTVLDWKFRSWRLKPAAGRHVLAAVVWQAGPAAPEAQLTNGGGFILKASGVYDGKLTTGKADWRVGRVSGISFTDADEFGWNVGWTTVSTGTGFLELFPQKTTSAVVIDGRPIGNDCGGRRAGWLLSPSQIPPQMERSVRPGCLRAGGEMRFPLTVSSGEKRVFLWDLEDYYCAYPVLEASGGKGATVTWTWAESLFEPGIIKDGWGRKGNRDEWKGKNFFGKHDVFKLDGRAEARFSTPWWRCGRWCQIEVVAGDEPVVIKNLSIVETRYPLEDEGSFSSDDETLPTIARLCLRGNQMCTHDITFDCPYYEQRMYDGDTCVQLEMLSALTVDDRIVKRAIELFDQSRQTDGLTAMNFPNRNFQGSATFTMCWALMFGDYVMKHRDWAWLRARWPGLSMAMEGLRTYENDEGLLVGLPGWCFVDWINAWNVGVAPDGNSTDRPSAINNLFWVLAMRSTARTARALGEDEQSAWWERRAARTAAAIVARFWDERRGLVADTLDRRSYSEHAQALAILADVLTPEQSERVVHAVENDADLHRATVYFSYYLFKAFFRLGRGDLFLKRLDLWREFVRIGLRTPLESPPLDDEFDPRSDCHAWGSHPLYFMRTGLAGIRSAALGFARVEVAPAPGPLRYVEAAAPHPDGKVLVDLRFDGTNVSGRVRTPVPGVFRWHGWSLDLKKGENVIRRDELLDREHGVE